MERLAQHAGFIAAHAVWCLSDGDSLIPIVSEQDAAGQLSLIRIGDERLEDAAAHGQRMLEKNEHGAAEAVLVFDGYAKVPSGRTDALIVSARRYDPEPLDLRMVVPYRPASTPEGFIISQPAFVGPIAEELIDPVFQAFFLGVSRHEKGGAIWRDNFDANL